MAAQSIAIRLQGISAVFHHERRGDITAVKNLDLEVRPGEFLTLLGASGCGKTTTLRLIAGLEIASQGRILIGDEDVTTLSASERDVSMVFQSYALFPHMSVVQNVGYGLEMTGVGRHEIRDRARASLATVGLEGYDDRLPSELSGGQQQRVALARSLVLEPSVLLFDEPLSNLDARLRRSMREEIRALQRRLELTVAYVTHDQSEALAVSDQIIVMNAGAIAQAGTPEDLYDRPCSEFVAGFMGEAMLFPAQALPDGVLALGPLRLPLRTAAAPGAVKAAVRPEAWTVGATGGPGMPGKVAKQSYLGCSQELMVETDLGPIFVVCPETLRLWAPGDAVSLSLNGQGVSIVSASP